MTQSSLLGEEFLRRLEYFRIASRRPARGHLKGIHRAKRTGSGMEFTDYRPYSEGDDLKSVDWRTYLRLDRLILRLFEEEADLPIYIFLDTSASMNFGAPSKFEYGRKVAAALAYMGFINMDRVSLIATADRVVTDLSGQRGKNQVWPAFDFLRKLSVSGKTALTPALKRYFAVPRARGLVVLISDFLDRAGFEDAFNVLRHFRHDVVAVHVLAPEEMAPVLEQDVMLEDAEEGTLISYRVSPALIDSYQKMFEQYCAEIESYCARQGWSYVRAATDVAFEELVLRTLRQRGLVR